MYRDQFHSLNKGDNISLKTIGQKFVNIIVEEVYEIDGGRHGVVRGKPAEGKSDAKTANYFVNLEDGGECPDDDTLYKILKMSYDVQGLTPEDSVKYIRNNWNLY